jgi:hypothetical protein
MRSVKGKERVYLSAIRVNLFFGLVALITIGLIRYYWLEGFSSSEVMTQYLFDLKIIGIFLLAQLLITGLINLFKLHIAFLLFEFWMTLSWSLFFALTTFFNLAYTKMIKVTGISTISFYKEFEREGLYLVYTYLSDIWHGFVIFFIIGVVIFFVLLSWFSVMKISLFTRPSRLNRFLRTQVALYVILVAFMINGFRLNFESFQEKHIAAINSNISRLYSANYLFYKALSYHEPIGFPKVDIKVYQQSLKKQFGVSSPRIEDTQVLLSKSSANILGENYNLVVFVLDGVDGYWKKFNSQKFPLIPNYLNDQINLKNVIAASDTKEGNISSLLLGIPMPSFNWSLFHTENEDLFRTSVGWYFRKNNYATYYVSENNLLELDKKSKISKLGFERIITFYDGYYRSLKFLRRQIRYHQNSFWLIEGCKNIEINPEADRLQIPKEFQERIGDNPGLSYFKRYRSCLDLTVSTIQKLQDYNNTFFVILGSSNYFNDYVYQKNELEGRLDLGAWIIPPSDLSLEISESTYTGLIDIMPTLIDVFNTNERYFSMGKSLFDVKEGIGLHPDFQFGKDAQEKYRDYLNILSGFNQVE